MSIAKYVQLMCIATPPPSLIFKGGYQIPPLAWDEIDTPWEIGLKILQEMGCKIHIKFTFSVYS